MAYNKPNEYPYYPRPQDIPAGFEIIKEGMCQRGDRYWDWYGRKWHNVEDNHSFLGNKVASVKCVVRPVPPPNASYAPVREVSEGRRGTFIAGAEFFGDDDDD